MLIKKDKASKKLCPKSLLKIGSVIDEIFLISTNVARTLDAWTNVTAKVVQDGPRNLPLKFGQNQVSDS